MFDYAKLLSLCMEVLHSYENATVGLEQHFEMFLAHKKELCNEEEEAFVCEVFTGCVRYGALIKVVVDGFKATLGTNYLRDDLNLYSVLLYLMMFRLDELGVAELKKFVFTQRIRKIYKFLDFIYCKDNLHGWIKDEWCKLYDSSFVECNILTPMMKNEGAMMMLITELRDKVNGRQIPPPVPSVTEPRPFNLTVPKPRGIDYDEVEEIPTMKPTKPVPSSTYRRPNIEKKLKKEYLENKRKSEMSVIEAEKQRFSCATTEKSDKTLAIMDKIISEKEEREKLSSFQALPAPSPKRESKTVKMTTAAIMREGARVMKEEEEEERRLADLDAGGRDPTEFYKWREEMAQKDAAEEKARVARKHLEGQLTYEEAIIAKKKNIEDNRQAARRFRDESEMLMQRYFEHRQEEQQEMRRLVEATTRGHHNTQLIRDKLTAMKRKIVQQVARENQELMARALEEEEERMRQKTELIKQIRAAESFPVLRTNFVDLTETSGHGFLSEMSIAELQERLALKSIADEERKKAKRNEIQLGKKAKEELLYYTKEAISKHKEDRQRQSASMQHSHMKEQLLEESLNKMEVTDLKVKLELRKKERERFQDLVSAPVSSMKTTRNITTKPPAVKLTTKTKGTKDSCRAVATSNISVPHTQNAMATLMKATNKT